MKIKALVRKAMGKLAGVNKLQDQVDSLFYILNACVDIRNFPTATGETRDLQMCDTALLKIFDKVCKKHNLTYWLEAGTLLGAVRHRGFIPWDDDLDVCMPRDSFDKAKDALCEELRFHGLQAEEDIPMGRIGIGYKHKQTGIWLDVFPADYCSLDLHNQQNRATMATHIQKYIKYYLKNKTKKPQSALQMKKQSIFPELSDRENAASIFFGPEAVAFVVGLNCDEMYPLQNITFEGHDFPAPANAHAYLVQWYGENYMKFPKDGFFHHGDASGQLIHWAKNSDTDMAQIQKELEEILKNI